MEAKMLLLLMLSPLVGFYWSSKGRSFAAGTVVSLIFTPIVGFFVGMLLSPREEAGDAYYAEHNYKICPQCAEWVRQQAKLCRFCRYEFGDRLYETIKDRLKTADEFCRQLVREHGDELPGLGGLLNHEQYRILHLPDDFEENGKSFSHQKLQYILSLFPTREDFCLALEQYVHELLTTQVCPFCHFLQSRDNVVCKNCYRDLAQVNPDTGEIEPISLPPKPKQ